MRILVDSLEKEPFHFTRPVRQVRFAPPDTGDYSIEGLEQILRIERKRPEELWICTGHRRERFRSQLERLGKFPLRLLVVEGTVSDLARVQPRGESRMCWPAVASRLMSWSVEFGVPVWFIGTRSAESVQLVEDLLISCWHHWTRTRSLPACWSGLWRWHEN